MIEIYKGDTKSITVILKDQGTQVDFVTGDTVTMEVNKKNSLTNEIEKVVTSFTDGKAIINLTSDDTNINKATYEYQIKYDKANGERYTIVSNLFVVR